MGRYSNGQIPADNIGEPIGRFPVQMFQQTRVSIKCDDARTVIAFFAGAVSPPHPYVFYFFT